MSTSSRSATSGGVAIRPHVEADDDRVRRRGQQHVRLVDRADARADDADLDLLVRQLRQRVGEHLRRALHVGLDDDRQLLDAAFGDLLLQRFERQAAALGAERALLGLRLAERGDLARLGRRRPRSGTDRRAAGGSSGRAPRRASTAGRLHRASAIVDQRAHAADDGAGDEVVADAQRAVLHEHGGHRTAAAIELGLEHRARRAAASGSP